MTGDVDIDDLAGEDCEGWELLPDEDNRREVERATLCLVNAERAQCDSSPGGWGAIAP